MSRDRHVVNMPSTGSEMPTHKFSCDNSNILFFLPPRGIFWLLLINNIKLKMARKPGKKHEENPVGCTGEGKRWKGNKRRVREDKTGTACISVWRCHLMMKWPLRDWLSQVLGRVFWTYRYFRKEYLSSQYLFWTSRYYFRITFMNISGLET